MKFAFSTEEYQSLKRVKFEVSGICRRKHSVPRYWWESDFWAIEIKNGRTSL